MTNIELICAVLSCAAYGQGRSPQNTVLQPPGAIPVSLPGIPNGHFVDTATGFEASLYQYQGQYIVAYAGTDPTDRNDLKTDAMLGFGVAESQLQQAADFYQKVKLAVGENVLFTGHSLGGGLAGLMGVFFNKPAITFDPAPFRVAATMQNATALHRYLTTATNTHPAFPSDADLASYVTTEQSIYIAMPDLASTLSAIAATPMLVPVIGSGISAKLASFLLTRQYPVSIRGEQNVKAIAVSGEFLTNGFNGFGSSWENKLRIQNGPQPELIDINPSGVKLGPFDLHSMALLTAAACAPALVDLFKAMPFVVGQLFDKGLYATAPKEVDPDFLTRLVQQEFASTSSAGFIGKYATSLTMLTGDAGIAQTLLQRPLSVVAMEYFRVKTYDGATSAFQSSGNGLHFRYSDIGVSSYKSKPLLSNAIASYVAGDGPSGVSHSSLALADSWHIQSGTAGMVWTASQTENDVAVGGPGVDILDAGAGNDILIGGPGIDFLTGGDGNDTVLGGIGADQIRGGKGVDVLVGGTEADTYYVTSNEGRDTIRDSDGQGSIIIDGQTLGQTRGAGFNAWTDQNGFRYAFVATDGQTKGKLTISNASGQQVCEIEDFDLVRAKGSAGFLGIKMPTDARVALVTNGHSAGGAGNPFSEWGFEPANLEGASTTGVTQGVTVYLSHAASATSTLVLHLGDLAGLGLKAVLGDTTVEAEGAYIPLVEGQTQVSFALVAESAVDEATIGSVTVTLTDGVDSETSNPWNLTWTSDPKPQQTFTGDAPQSSSQKDLLGGTGNADLMQGLTDNDALLGYAGADSMEGGTGTDVLMGGLGSDTMKGGAGDDVIYGSSNGTFDPAATLDVQNIIGVGQNWVYYGTGSNDPDGFRNAYLDGMARDIQQGDEGNEIEGGDGNDVVLAGTGDDLVEGGEGRDDIKGMGGCDVLLGDAGDDRIRGDGSNFDTYVDYTPPNQAGADFLDGGTGNDILLGQGGNDDVFGGDDDDRMWGDDRQPADTPAESHGIDYLDGENGNDTIYGGGRDDELFGGAGNDELWGDEYLVDNIDADLHGADYIDAEEGDDSLFGGGKDDLLWGGDGNDVLYGDDPLAERTPEALQGQDCLDGEAGDDSLVGGAKADELFGDEGNDLLWGDDGGHAPGETGSLDPASDGADYLDGEAGNDSLIGEGEADVLFGGEGNDSLVGDDAVTRLVAAFHGDDELDGEAGDDSLVGNGGADMLFGGEGNDVLLGDADDVSEDQQGDDELDGGEGDDGLKGHGGDDALQGGAGNDTLEGDAGLDLLDGGDGDDQLMGGEDEDVLQGGAGADSLQGHAGDDDLSGGEDADQLEGGDGDDLLAGEADNDSLYGGEGDDYIDGADGNDYLQGDGGADMLSGGAGNDFARGEAGDDEVNGDAGDDQLQGNDGNDLVYGGEGDDTLFGQLGDDELDGGSGVDQLQGGEGNDTLVGEGADVLFGQSGDDLLIGDGAGGVYASGGDGNDYLANAETMLGGNGDDTILVDPGSVCDGGAGNDTYVFDFAGATSLLLQGMQDTLGANDIEVSGVANTAMLTIVPSVPWQLGQPADLSLLRLDTGNGRIDVRNWLSGAVGTITINGVNQGAGDFFGQHFAYALDQSSSAAAAVLQGGAQGDVLSATGGNATLRGGAGADTLTGSGGHNTYVFNRGDGMDSIADSSPVGQGGTLRLGPGIAPADVVGLRSGDDVMLAVTGTDDLITIRNYFSASVEAVEVIRFASGEVWGMNEVLAAIAHGDAIDWVLHGDEGGNVLLGMGGNDELHGHGGYDQLYGGAGNDTLEGGTGDDSLFGGAGSDVYLAGAGDGGIDLADESTSGDAQGVDTMRFEDVTSAQVRFLIQGSNLNVMDGSGIVRMVAVNQFLADGAANRIERFEFSDGVVLTAAQIHARVMTGSVGAQWQTGSPIADNIAADWGADTVSAGAGNDTVHGDQGQDSISGETGDDALFGDAGDDTIYGNEGNDTLDGGIGWDRLDGGAGNDTYAFGIGSGMDIVPQDAGGIDTVLLGAGIAAANVKLWRVSSPAAVDLAYGGDSLAVQLNDGGDQLWIANYFAAGASTIETIRFADNTVWDAAAIQSRLQVPQTGGTAAAIAGTTKANTFTIDHWSDVISDPTTGDADVANASASYRLPDSVQVLNLSGSLNLFAAGSGMSDQLRGNTGDNRYVHHVDKNNSATDPGADQLIGGRGNDLYVITASNTVVEPAMDPFDRGGATITELAGEGMDTMMTGYWSSTLPDNVENLILVRPSAVLSNHWYFYGSSPSDYTHRFTGNALANVIDASQYEDAASSQPWIGKRSVSFWSTVADFRLDGGAGADTLIGGLWHDTYVIDNAGDTVIELGIRPDGGDVSNDTVETPFETSLATQFPNIENVTLTGTAAVNATGNALNNRLDGSRNAAANRLTGGTGDDTYSVGTGDTVVELAGEGTDTVIVTSVAGGTGRLSDYANVEHIHLANGAGNINAEGNAGDNQVTGSMGGNVLSGLDGNDMVTDQRIQDVTYYYGPQPAADADVLDGGAGNDTLQSYGGADTFAGGAGDDRMHASYAGRAVTVLMALGGGADLLTQDSGQTLDVTVQLATGIRQADVQVITADGMQSIVLSDGTRLDTQQANRVTLAFQDGVQFDGTSGADLLVGGGSNDTLLGGAGNDTLAGGRGADLYRIASGTGNDVIDDLFTGSGYAQEDGKFDLVHMTGVLPSGVTVWKQVTGAAATALVLKVNGTADSVTLMQSYATGNTGAVEALRFADGTQWDLATLKNPVAGTMGSSGSDTLAGGTGNDVLDGAAGSDSMAGGAGNDTYHVDVAGDIVSEASGAGTDTVIAWFDGYVLPANVDHGQLAAGTQAWRITGNTLANSLMGNAGNNRLDGGSGTDTMAGGAGNDTYVMDVSADLITEASGQGWDTVESALAITLPANVDVLRITSTGRVAGTGNSGNNALVGNAGINTLNGGAGHDLLMGAAGNDVLQDTSGNGALDGGAGNDTLTVSGGNDFLAGGTGTDTITFGGGADIFAFNRGDGADAVNAPTAGAGQGESNDTVSLGRIRLDEIRLSRETSDLVIKVNGTTDALRLKGWYTSAANQTVVNLQMVTESATDYAPDTQDALRSNRVTVLDFKEIVAFYDAARVSNPSLVNWQPSEAQLQGALLAASNLLAYGGIDAYRYAKDGTLASADFEAAVGQLAVEVVGTAVAMALE